MSMVNALYKLKQTPADLALIREGIGIVLRLLGPIVGKTVVRPPPPRCRKGVNSPYLPTCPFQALGGSIQSTP
jgi:hypothetical protein